MTTTGEKKRPILTLNKRLKKTESMVQREPRDVFTPPIFSDSGAAADVLIEERSQVYSSE